VAVPLPPLPPTDFGGPQRPGPQAGLRPTRARDRRESGKPKPCVALSRQRHRAPRASEGLRDYGCQRVAIAGEQLILLPGWNAYAELGR